MKPTSLLFLALLLTACTAVTPSLAPTATPPPSATSVPSATPAPTATATPTLVPTPTPTPIPTLPPEQVGGLEGVPDPRVTNPELFDLARSDAPIPQFVNAMKMGGIEVNPQEVVDNLQYQTITGVDGKEYVIGTYHLDPNPQQQGETLEGPIPLVIGEQRENGEWRWGEINTKWLSNLLGFPFGGTIDSWSEPQGKYPQLFTAANLTYHFEWYNIEPTQGEVIFRRPETYAFADEKFFFAKKNGMDTFMIRFFYPQTYPEWLTAGNFTRDQLNELAIKHIHDILGHFNNHYHEIPDYVDLASEYNAWTGSPDVLRNTIGNNEFYTMAALETQRIAPDTTILVVDDHNERIGTIHYQNTVNLVELLKNAGINNIGVGMEMHLDGNDPPTKEQVIQAMRSYGVPIVVTEMDVNLKDVNGPDRFIKQAKVYKDMMDACLESGVCEAFFVFQIGDQYSWLENGGYMGAPNSDATLFDDDLNPKPAYYGIMQSFYNHLIKP